MYAAAVFSGEAVKFKQLDFRTGMRGKNLAGDLHKPVRFRHSAWTGVLVREEPLISKKRAGALGSSWRREAPRTASRAASQSVARS